MIMVFSINHEQLSNLVFMIILSSHSTPYNSWSWRARLNNMTPINISLSFMTQLHILSNVPCVAKIFLYVLEFSL